MTRLEHVIARNVIELRTEKKATQADLAAKMRGNGFAWSTNRVTQIETLRRPVSLLEVVGLSHVFLVPVERLLQGDDHVELPDGRSMDLESVRDALAGRSRTVVRDATEEDIQQTRGHELRKIAARAGMSPEEFDAEAHRIWGRSFWAERTLRASDISGLPTRSAQTRRGHVTRQLLAEMKQGRESSDG